MKSPLLWLGSKSQLRDTIISMIPEHKTYVEVFAGGAWVLFGKPMEISRAEVLNDIDGELINFYRVVKRKSGAFLKGFEWLLVSREIFNQLKDVDPSCLAPEERAVRFFYLMRASILGKRYSFYSCAARRPNLNLDRLEEIVRAVHERLKRVTIEHRDFEKLISMYDRPETFFYLDPPYWQMHLYRYNFRKEQHKRLAEMLRALKGKFILSYNDVRDIRKLYRGLTIQTVKPRYSAQGMSGKTTRKGNELLIRNF